MSRDDSLIERFLFPLLDPLYRAVGYVFQSRAERLADKLVCGDDEQKVNACLSLSKMGTRAQRREVAYALARATDDNSLRVRLAACAAISNVGRDAEDRHYFELDGAILVSTCAEPTLRRILYDKLIDDRFVAIAAAILADIRHENEAYSIAPRALAAVRSVLNLEQEAEAEAFMKL